MHTYISNRTPSEVDRCTVVNSSHCFRSCRLVGTNPCICLFALKTITTFVVCYSVVFVETWILKCLILVFHDTARSNTVCFRNKHIVAIQFHLADRGKLVAFNSLCRSCNCYVSFQFTHLGCDGFYLGSSRSSRFCTLFYLEFRNLKIEVVWSRCGVYSNIIHSCFCSSKCSCVFAVFR